MKNIHSAAYSRKTTGRGTIKNYTIGFAASIVLTLAAYFVVVLPGINLSYGMMVFAILGLAVAQLLVQLQFFIHLGPDPRPHWNKMMFLLMLLILLIVVIGSLWIMDNLHYNLMSPSETENYIMEEEGIKR